MDRRGHFSGTWTRESPPFLPESPSTKVLPYAFLLWHYGTVSRASLAGRITQPRNDRRMRRRGIDIERSYSQSEIVPFLHEVPDAALTGRPWCRIGWGFYGKLAELLWRPPLCGGRSPGCGAESERKV